ncbi:hypothetical protein Tco_0799429 [Tanacetum coccineum]|uniref:Reverse transcriptase/retrotransposon-derived protein RNase H-like domain-containing protein n=1 Tax=Tanacetum coccineum TaxID=301880 RepID=A0ABQ4ZSY9_9ASTR
MMKFPTPKGVATLVTRTVIIAECRRLERKQMIEEERPNGEGEVAVTEEVLVNPSFPDQLVTIKGGLSDAARDQLKCLLKDNLGVFAWEPSDMTGVLRRIIKHALNVNPSLDPAEEAFQQMKKLITDLPSLTPPREKETLYAYLGSYRTLNEAEINYAPMEKLALSLIHMTRRLQRFWRTILSEAPEGEEEELYFRMPEVPLEKDDIESWTLFTDGASGLKGSGAGLVLIGPSGIEYTYALRLTFPTLTMRPNTKLF